MRKELFQRWPIKLGALVSGLAMASCNFSTDAQISVPALMLPPPEGFCELRQQPQSASEVKTMSSGLARAKLELLAMSAECDQLEGWRARTRLLDDYAQYQSPAVSNSNSSTRPEWVKEYCAKARAEGKRKLPEATAAVNAIDEAEKLPTKLNDMMTLGVLAEDTNVCYVGMLSNNKAEDGTEKTQLGIVAVTVLKGRILNYILYTANHDANAVTATLARHKRNVAALLAANAAADEVAWGILKDTGNAEQLRRFVSQFPESLVRWKAEERLKVVPTDVSPLPLAQPVRPASDSSRGTKEVQIGSAAIALPRPEGFCELSKQHPIDALLIKANSSILTGMQIELLVMSADCSQLEGWRARTRNIEDYARYQTPTSTTDSSLSRAEWVKEFCANQRAYHEKNPAVITTNPDFNARAKEMGAYTSDLQGLISLGVLAEDADVCYIGSVQMARTKADTHTEVEVYGYTVVKGKIVQYGLYTEYRDADTLTAALARHRRNVAALLAANAPADEVVWSILMDTGTAEQLRRFISQFPNSPLRPEAETRLGSSNDDNH